ncbi:PREDICTED: oxoeicosanoid receptor 1 [Chrysochloris asiatica]|uniref:Oxoeicosanoid receptor 1 n=1 Tax=Chrysochloris asiatica TaxID=185453 RepID=A0A9B0T4P2_CHRAS|nr:PREDICTED: oxoeicosanoid receptor 1 [Chrysochloris asiatica]
MGSHNLSFPTPPLPFLSLFPTLSPSTLTQEETCSPVSSPTLSAVLAPILSMEFVLGLVGNSLAFIIFCFHTRPWTSNTVLLVCLVIADFFLIINLPLRVDYYLFQETWRFGVIACQINLFMISANRTASVVFLTAIAVNRYLKVVRPHHVLSQASVGATAWVAGGLWVGILLLNVHMLLDTSSSKTCLSYQLGTNSSASHRWHEVLLMLEFFLTLALILFAIVSIWKTIQQRGLSGQAGPRRAMHVLAMVVVVYTICFLPCILLGIVTVAAFELRACHTFNTCSQLFHGSLAFTYLNSALDPVLYCFSSPNFLRQVRALLGFTNSWQGSSSEDNCVLPSRRMEAPRKVEVTMKVKDLTSAAGAQ